MPAAITTTPADRTGTDRATGKRRAGGSDRDFHRAGHFQQIPQNTRAHQLLYPGRSDAGSLHRQLGQSRWNRRVISYGLARQKIYSLGFALSQNATRHHLYRELAASPTASESRKATDEGFGRHSLLLEY
ncbi:hypothetical protein PUR49_02070 [Streptomyces sp. BE147]|uniref:hypothetical protein n=1 Tax=Streptomyces sp. BE147 TaxID=3002524 RepID=UPI002E7A8454|nr:hypothetical protein [Streptomyces sp. BE147]MEE1735328.1 hypothetical protein [Streptomyces sp. BE147]